MLVSERFAEAFHDEGLTGAVRPCFGRAAADLSHSRIRYAKALTCEECRSEGTDAIHGFTLKPGTW